jgi:hypothetical protein
MADYEKHLEICDTLRQINEDDHDLRSGRLFPEFDFAGPQLEESMVNMTNWDTLLYTRNFEAIRDDRSMRQATRLLTYPYTVASVLHELSPYSVRSGGRLTTEGLKSFSGKSGKLLMKAVHLLTSPQLCVTRFILQRREVVWMSRAFDWKLPQCGSSFSEQEQSHLFPVMPGYN